MTHVDRNIVMYLCIYGGDRVQLVIQALCSFHSKLEGRVHEFDEWIFA
jgi:hypothetical protein